MRCFLPVFLLSTLELLAAEHTGVIRVQGKGVPGVAVIAMSGDHKLVTSTDENGGYRLDLPPGNWTVEAELFSFERQRKDVAQGDTPTTAEWDLRFAARLASSADRPQGAAIREAPARRGFQTAQLEATSELQETETAPALSIPNEEGAGESFLVAGSVSQGLQRPEAQDAPGGFFPGAGMMDRPGGLGEAQTGANPFAANTGDTQTSGQQTQGPGGGRAAGPGGGPGGGRGIGFGGGGGFGGRGGGPGGGGSRGGLGRGTDPERARQLRERMQMAGATFGNRRRRGQPIIRGMVNLTLGNSAFDARPYSLTGQTFDKPDYSQNGFGGTLGGQIPKTRTQYTINYSGGLNRNAYSQFGTVPTLLERAGDFSQSVSRGPVTVFDPLTNQPFAENRVPESRWNAAAVGLLSYVPLPNQPGSVQNYQFVTTIPRTTHALSTRINQSLSQKHRVSGGFNWTSRDNESAQLFGFTDHSVGHGYTLDGGWSWTLKPRTVNDLRVRVNRDRSETVPFFAGKDDTARRLGIEGPSTKPENFGPPNLNFTNLSDLADGSSVRRVNGSWSVTEGLNIVRGKHTVQLGAEFRRVRLDTNTDQNARGTFTFTGLLTSAFDANGQPLANTGYDFADFLLGAPQSSSIRFGTTDTLFRTGVYSAFVQDEWRARSNLTFNLGLRYDYYEPYKEKNSRLANLAVAPNFSGVTVVTPANQGYPEGLINPDRNNFSPRLGFAYRPFKTNRLQVRGGYSLFYDNTVYGTIANRLAGQPPFAQTAQLQTSSARQLTIQNGFGNDPTKQVTNTFAVAQDYVLPYAQTWSFAVQEEFAGGLVVEVNFVGTKGTRLDVLRLPNRAAPGSPLTAEQRRLIGNAVGFTYNSSEGNSIFHALQARVIRRMRRGVSTNVFYTWSKSIDNASNIGGSGNVVAQDDRNLAAERGLSVFDQRHQLTWSGMLNSPFGERGFFLKDKSLAARVLQSWNLMMVTTVTSGRPFTARVLGNVSDAGGTGAAGSSRADSTGLPVRDGGGLFNLAAFTTPPSGRFGNAGRNTIQGPGAITVNLSLGRSFTLSDRKRLELRAAADNVFNHVNYTSIGTVVNALNYGLYTGTAQMRTMNITMRLRF